MLHKKWTSYLLQLFVITGGIWAGLTLHSWANRETDHLVEAPSDLPDPLQAGWKGEKVCEVLKEDDQIRILKCVFPPGVGHEQHYHPPHTGYTLVGGTFQITDATGVREVNVPTGTSFGNDAISAHEVLNVGETTAEFLIIEPKGQR